MQTTEIRKTGQTVVPIMPIYARVEGVSLGKRRSELLAWIYLFIQSRGFPPSQTDIKNAFGINNGVAQFHLNKLIRLKCIDRNAEEIRTIRITCDLKLATEYEDF